jgi:hypothetical protein
MLVRDGQGYPQDTVGKAAGATDTWRFIGPDEQRTGRTAYATRVTALEHATPSIVERPYVEFDIPPGISYKTLLAKMAQPERDDFARGAPHIPKFT